MLSFLFSQVTAFFVGVLITRVIGRRDRKRIKLLLSLLENGQEMLDKQLALLDNQQTLLEALHKALRERSAALGHALDMSEINLGTYRDLLAIISQRTLTPTDLAEVRRWKESVELVLNALRQQHEDSKQFDDLNGVNDDDVVEGEVAQ